MDKFPGELTIKGLETDEYSWFSFDSFNRKLDKEALSNLKDDLNEDVKDGEYPFQAPVVVYWVNGMTEGVIQQGHHRFTVCKEEERRIRYTITDSYRPSSRGQENQHQDWTTEELVFSYSEEGIESYKLLQKLKNEHPNYSLVVLTTFINGYPASSQSLRERNFKTDKSTQKENYGLAKQRIIKFEEFNRAAQRTDKPKETVKVLIEALGNVNFDWKYFIERTSANAQNAKLHPEFKSISTKARAKALIEFYYNHNSRKNFFLS